MPCEIKHIFLDMDGVISDFVTASLTLHGWNGSTEDLPPGDRDMARVVGVTRSHFWSLIDAQGADFWATLPPFPWFADLVGLVREFAPMTILTSPSLSPSCLEGKVRWLYTHFPKVNGRCFSDFLIGNQKYLLAAPGRVLLDDTESHVNAFREAGGNAILFPQRWNRNHAVDDRIAYVRTELNAIANGERMNSA